MKILIADSGSTKTHWCLVDEGGAELHFSSEGYNPNYLTREYLVDSLRKALPAGFDPLQVTHLHFYGAGCSTDRYDFMRTALSDIFVTAQIEIAMDLLASARALLGREAGLAAILGTGTNSCLYDGECITHNIDSLGFILGDEGSGGYIGKSLLSDYIRGCMPDDVRQLFMRPMRFRAMRLSSRSTHVLCPIVFVRILRSSSPIIHILTLTNWCAKPSVHFSPISSVVIRTMLNTLSIVLGLWGITSVLSWLKWLPSLV